MGQKNKYSLQNKILYVITIFVTIKQAIERRTIMQQRMNKKNFIGNLEKNRLSLVLL